MLNITICGGGNLAHAQAAYLARKGHVVNIYTRRPQAWSSSLDAFFFDVFRVALETYHIQIPAKY